MILNQGDIGLCSIQVEGSREFHERLTEMEAVGPTLLDSPIKCSLLHGGGQARASGLSMPGRQGGALPIRFKSLCFPHPQRPYLLVPKSPWKLPLVPRSRKRPEEEGQVQSPVVPHVFSGGPTSQQPCCLRSALGHAPHEEGKKLARVVSHGFGNSEAWVTIPYLPPLISRIWSRVLSTPRSPH